MKDDFAFKKIKFVLNLKYSKEGFYNTMNNKNKMHGLNSEFQIILKLKDIIFLTLYLHNKPGRKLTYLIMNF